MPIASVVEWFTPQEKLPEYSLDILIKFKRHPVINVGYYLSEKGKTGFYTGIADHARKSEIAYWCYMPEVKPYCVVAPLDGLEPHFMEVKHK